MDFDWEKFAIPLAVALGGVLFYFFVWKKETEFNPVKVPPPINNDDPIEKTMTLEELATHDGVQKPTSYLAVKNFVFDVTGQENYVAGGGYSMFVGKEISVALARMKFGDEGYNCYNTTKLSLSENDTLNDWFIHYKKKYKIVAQLEEVKKDK